MNSWLFQKINDLAGQSVCLDSLGIFFAEYFGYLLAVLVFVVFWKKYRIIFQSFLAGIVARFGFTELIRWLWPNPRPFVDNNVNLLLSHTDSASLPSGHAAFFFGLSTVVYLYNKKAGLLFFAASFLISISRVFGGIHWPLDVLVGAVVGIFSGWLVIKICQHLRR